MGIVVDSGMLGIPVHAAMRNVSHLPQGDGVARDFHQTGRRANPQLELRIYGVGHCDAVHGEEVKVNRGFERGRGKAPDAGGVLRHRYGSAGGGLQRREPVTRQRDYRRLRCAQTKRDGAIGVNFGRHQVVRLAPAARARSAPALCECCLAEEQGADGQSDGDI